MPDPINFTISYITNVETSNNIQNLNNALIASKSTNMEEHIKRNEEANTQVNNTEEKAETSNINDNQQKNSSEQRKKNKEKKKEKIVIDDYRGHSLDIRI
jgi:predicted Holliday junction resolvase-like endonuclease